MSEHTPTTEDLRDYIRAADRVTAHMFSAESPDAVDAFDRWLAAHDAEVRAQTLVQARQIAEVRAGVVAEEPEWEYGIKAEGDDEPYTDTSLDVDWLCDQVTPEPGDSIVRRRKAGPWIPVKQEGAEHD